MRYYHFGFSCYSSLLKFLNINKFTREEVVSVYTDTDVNSKDVIILTDKSWDDIIDV